MPVAKYEHQNEVQDTSSRIKLSDKNKKNGFLDIEIQALTKDGYFRKDLDKFLYFNPITYGILPFRQLRGGGGGGLFGPDPENKVTVNGLI